jgi:hypothetical protein
MGFDRGKQDGDSGLFKLKIMIQLKDVIRYYIGQPCRTPDGDGTIQGLPWTIVGRDRIHVHFGKKMVHMKNSIDGGYNQKRNHGDYALHEVRYEPLKSTGITKDGFDMPGGIVPLLRKLEDMTDEECDNYNALKETLFNMAEGANQVRQEAAAIHYLLQQGFDLFGLCESGQAIDQKTLNQKV